MNNYTIIWTIVFSIHALLIITLSMHKMAINTPHKKLVIRAKTIDASKKNLPPLVASLPVEKKNTSSHFTTQEKQPSVKKPSPQALKQNLKTSPQPKPSTASKKDLPSKKPIVKKAPLKPNPVKKPPPRVNRAKTPPKKQPNKAPVKHLSTKQMLTNVQKNMADITEPRTLYKAQSTHFSLTEEKKTEEYLFSLSNLFQESLTLPEKGKVKVTITVQANGKIVKIKSSEFSDGKNLEYLQLMLPMLTLPPLEEEKDFVITFWGD